MTGVLVSLVVCGSALAGLVLALRFLERREARAAARVTSDVEAELRDEVAKLKDRAAKLEMARNMGR